MPWRIESCWTDRRTLSGEQSAICGCISMAARPARLSSTAMAATEPKATNGDWREIGAGGSREKSKSSLPFAYRSTTVEVKTR